MRRLLFGSLVIVLLALPPAASAIPPTLVSVGHQDRRLTATFSAPRARSVTVIVVRSPERDSSGFFLPQNRELEDYIISSREIQGGLWASKQVNPGTYYVMISALANTNCRLPGPNPGFDLDPACADGRSQLAMVVVPEPVPAYTTTAIVSRSKKRVTLRLEAKPLGYFATYKVCWRDTKKRKKCRGGQLLGTSWNSGVTDRTDVKLRGLAMRTKFTWTVDGKAVATRTMKTG